MCRREPAKSDTASSLPASGVSHEGSSTGYEGTPKETQAARRRVRAESKREEWATEVNQATELIFK